MGGADVLGPCRGFAAVLEGSPLAAAVVFAGTPQPAAVVFAGTPLSAAVVFACSPLCGGRLCGVGTAEVVGAGGNAELGLTAVAHELCTGWHAMAMTLFTGGLVGVHNWGALRNPAEFYSTQRTQWMKAKGLLKSKDSVVEKQEHRE
eukprot:1159905-Pelagomonas_calceolata.AAC.4